MTATKMEVIFKQLVNKAAKGDHRSIQLLISYLERHPPIQPASTMMTAADLDGRMNLLGDALRVLLDLGVPAVTGAVDEAVRSRIASGETGPKSG